MKVRGQFVALIFSTIDLRVRLVCRLHGKYVYLLSNLTDPFRTSKPKTNYQKKSKQGKITTTTKTRSSISSALKKLTPQKPSFMEL